MSEPGKSYKRILVTLALVLLVGVAFVQKELNRARTVLGLTRVTPLENAPPVLAFTTVALGGFRGLIADILWTRAVDLQDDGKYFEMVQLADWITKLQPHMGIVWVNQAWNMAYNISIKFQDFRERWTWVRKGIELLRDEGLRYNPHETLIYRELAWFFQHKMGANLDDAQLFYKRTWAEAMMKLFPNGHPDYVAFLDPKTREQNDALKALREVYKMDPQVMKQVDERYGPLDWRLPETHSIYWAWLGLHQCKTDLITLRRVIYQSMQLVYMRGRLIQDKSGKTFMLGPNLDCLDNANRAYEDMMDQDPENREHIKTTHRNFLKDAVYFLYTYNRRSDAARWFRYLAQKYPEKTLLNSPDSYPSKITVDEYCLDRLREDAGETSMDRTKSLVEGLLVNSYSYLATGFEDESINFRLMAQKIYNQYQQKIEGQKARIGLEPFDKIRQEVLDGCLGPESRFSPEMKAQLRTELGLPAPPAPEAGPTNPPAGQTNAPPSSPQPQTP
jgi:hypothetical protein